MTRITPEEWAVMGKRDREVAEAFAALLSAMFERYPLKDGVNVRKNRGREKVRKARAKYVAQIQSSYRVPIWMLMKPGIYLLAKECRLPEKHLIAAASLIFDINPRW